MQCPIRLPFILFSILSAIILGYTKLETPVTLMLIKQLGAIVITWMGDHSGVGYSKIPEAEKRGLHYTVRMLLGQKIK